ncbi:MAG: DnaJ domain-containing protein [Deltaproteobacteria bacterium]|nr:DnaJ domain-containing protein [Deltaproteobacteria bacterium]
MEYKDYYKILGVDKTATGEEIKKSYRKLARKYHPDVNPNDKTAESKFKEVQEAYDILKDEKKRKEYDELGTNYFNYKNAGAGAGASNGQYYYDYSGGGNSGFGYNYGNAGGGNFNFEDIFSDLFNRSGKKHGPVKGGDLNASLEISVPESVKGAERIINLNGEKIKIKIPAGIADGGKIKLSGKGSPGLSGAPNGDLYITISVLNDNVFERKDNDIYVNKKIKLTEAVLGAKVEVSSIDGKFMLTIPAGTQNGTKFRIPKKGAKDISGKKIGDLIVTVTVDIPSGISEKIKKTFMELSKEGI